MSETKTQITLPTYVNKGKARDTGVFEVLTIEQVRAWSEPKRQECDHNVPINHLSQEQEMQNSRVYLGTPYCYDCQTRDIHLPTCRFFACGRCSGTGVQSIDLTPSIDVLIGGHGLEAIHGRSGKVVAEYSNQGDTYAPTLMFRNGHCWVNNWGDFVESYERRHGKLN